MSYLSLILFQTHLCVPLQMLNTYLFCYCRYFTWLKLYIHVHIKSITHGGFFIYIKLGILSLCTEPWHGTRSICISWDFCLYWKAIWWIDDVYRYWLWIHTHLSTTFNLTLNCSLILTHVRLSDQYYRG